MTDLIEKVLSNMSEKFNQPSKIVEINLNDDKTLKWRGLHNNQYAAAKRKKDGTKQQRPVRSKSNCADDPPPLMNDSGNSSSVINGGGAAGGSNNDSNSSASISVRAVPSSRRTMAESNGDNSGNDGIDSVDAVAADDDEPGDEKNNSADKDTKSDVQPLRRTLRRKANTADDQIDDVSSQSSAKKSMRSKRQPVISDTVSEAGSSTSKGDEATRPNENSGDSVVTRRRGRARKMDTDGDESASKSVTSLDDASNDTQVMPGANAQPPKLRRSERMHGSAASLEQQKDVASGETVENEDGHAHDQNAAIDISATARKTRKRTIDEKKSPELRDETIFSVNDAVAAAAVVVIEVKKSDVEAIADVKPADEAPPKKEIEEEVRGEPSSSIMPRKRGRKPGTKLKQKTDLKVNMTIATRSSPIKKSPRFSSDESPFTYTLSKKDKNEQVIPEIVSRYIQLIIFSSILLATTAASVAPHKANAEDSRQRGAAAGLREPEQRAAVEQQRAPG